MDVGVGAFVFCRGISAKQDTSEQTSHGYLVRLASNLQQSALLVALGR